MQPYFIDLVTSEFTWGIILGVILSIVASWANLKLQRDQQKQAVAGFISDIILSIEDYVKALLDHQERNRVIHREFLDLIDVEIAVWGRNREHMVAIDRPELRKATRQFFTSTATTITQIKLNLDCFNSAIKLANESKEVKIAENHKINGESFLSEAHNGCRKLDAIIKDSAPLKKEVLFIAKQKVLNFN